MILSLLSLLGRLGAVTASLIVVGLNAKFITERLWLTDLLVYIEVVAGVSVVAALVPPYPNFLYDSFWAAVWIIAAIFALVVQFAESNCYGLQPHSPIECATYKAGTAFAFIALFSWLGSAFMGGLDILALLANVGNRYWGRPLHLGATEKDNTVSSEEVRKVKGLGNSHVARWFICYGFLGVIVLAVGIPMMIIYAAPAFARYLIRGIPIPDNVRIQLRSPTNDSIGVTIESDVWVPDGGDVTFYPMDVTFFSNDEYPDFDPIASISLPRLKYKSREHLNIPEQRLQLGNLDAFARFIEHAAFNSTFTLGGIARAKVKIAMISTEVDLYKSVTFPAFNAFPTIEFKEIGLKTRDANGYNLHAKVVLENPTPASATLGDVTLNAMIGDFIIGEGRVSVANIIPGKNTFDVDAKLNITNIQNNINAIMAIELPYLKREQIIVSASVTSVVYEGEHLPYWEEAFGRLEIALARPIRPLVQSILDSGFLGSYMSPIVKRVLNIILENVKEMDEDDLEDYAEGLGEIGTRALSLLSTLGIL
ncbi:hypothetical protein BJX68DRAFT_261763 [Aspergillus pseudodeflectus]|uniref:Uncharacterized protein n=1 Tax=Aspergillus pseudodeflectus TaxID=176178 RepID=A0ABR4L456_9EURO